VNYSSHLTLISDESLATTGTTTTKHHRRRSQFGTRLVTQGVRQAPNISTTFLDLPSELRNRIYEQVLVVQERIDPWVDYNQRQQLTIGLLRANKTVHSEASSVLYAQNCFDFTLYSASEEVASFLEQIGRENAIYIRHVYINFPTFPYLDPHDVTLMEDSVCVLQSKSVNLSTLTTSLWSTNAMELKLEALEHPKIVVEALALVNARFRAISSQTIVEVYKDGPSDHIRNEMKSHGWTIKETEQVEEPGSGRSLGGIEEDYPYDYDDDDYGGDDDYDIETIVTSGEGQATELNHITYMTEMTGIKVARLLSQFPFNRAKGATKTDFLMCACRGWRELASSQSKLKIDAHRSIQLTTALRYPVHDVEGHIHTPSCSMRARGFQSLAFPQEAGYYDTQRAHHFFAY